MSWVLPLGGVEDAVVKQVGVRVVAVDFEHLGDEPASRPSFHLHNDMERIRDIGLDGSVREVDPALENTARESGKSLLRRICVNGRERPRMPRIQELQEIERFSTANLACLTTILLRLVCAIAARPNKIQADLSNPPEI